MSKTAREVIIEQVGSFLARAMDEAAKEQRAGAEFKTCLIEAFQSEVWEVLKARLDAAGFVIVPKEAPGHLDQFGKQAYRLLIAAAQDSQS